MLYIYFLLLVVLRLPCFYFEWNIFSFQNNEQQWGFVEKRNAPWKKSVCLNLKKESNIQVENERTVLGHQDLCLVKRRAICSSSSVFDRKWKGKKFNRKSGTRIPWLILGVTSVKGESFVDELGEGLDGVVDIGIHLRLLDEGWCWGLSSGSNS